MQKKIDGLGILMYRFVVLAIVFFVIGLAGLFSNLIMENQSDNQRARNDAWLVLEQPSDDEAVATLYNLIKTDETVGQRLESFSQIWKNRYSSNWYGSIGIYIGSLEEFQSILEGSASPQDMLVEVTDYPKWPETLGYISLGIAFSFVGLIALTVIMFALLWLYNKIQIDYRRLKP